MAEFEFNTNHQGPGDNFLDDRPIEGRNELASVTAHPMDSEEARSELRRLLEFYYFEKDRQAANRLEMAIDADFYDGIQWDPEDAQVLRDRGQMPLVYNEVAPMVDWLIGTERRTRVDWKVMPRTEEDVELADVKTKVMKYVADVNRVQFNRSRAFADAVKVGVGWMDDGVRDDPTADMIYAKNEDWRNVLWDSLSYEHDLSDARYLFRWRWVDEDIAVAMFPDRADVIRQAVEDAQHASSVDWEEETWFTADELLSGATNGTLRSSGQASMIDAKRRRVRLIEAQYRKPVKTKIVNDGPLKGSFFNEQDQALLSALGQSGGSIIDKVMMRVHMAVFTESHMLAMAPSVFRHNRFTLTPVWCYRRGRDRMPYGVIRRVRDIQQDLNKRASKALFLLNTNQIIADEGATDDWNLLRDEADRPDGLIIKKQGKELMLRRDTDAATGQMQMMTLDAQSIQKSAGVSQENLGRQTNAVSGEAIKARQLQGSVVTTEPFDNLRLAVQIQGEKQLSMVEQFYTEEKVVRLTGAKGALEWVKVNQPELQVDGSVRFLNDITASAADFIVSEADYAGTMRQVMFDALNQLASRLPPEVSLRLMTIAMDFSDMPNKDEVADQIRKLTGERDPNKPMTPEETQQMQQQMQAQAESLQMQRQQAMQALEEQQAKIREINARAVKLESEANAAMAGDGGQAAQQAQADMQNAIMQVQRQASQEIERLSEQLRKAQSDLANRTMQIRSDADATLEAARIDADAKVRMAEIQAASDKQIAAIQKRLDQAVQAMEDKLKQQELKQREREVTEKETEKPEPAPAPAPAPQAAPVTINLQVDAKSGEVKKSISFKRDAAGNIVGAESSEQPSEKD
jgi:hypothetical protein